MGEIRLNIGVGDGKIDGYLGVDIRPVDSNVDVMAPAWKLPYQDGEVTEIFSSDMCEHLTHPEWIVSLKEWHRVLRPGGKLTIITPDLDAVVKARIENKQDYYDIQRYLYGAQSYAENYHKQLFDFAHLKLDVEHMGFEKAVRAEHNHWLHMRLEAING